RGRGGPGRPEEPAGLLPLPPRDQPGVDGADGLPHQVLRLDLAAGDRRDLPDVRPSRGPSRPRLPAPPGLLPPPPPPLPPPDAPPPPRDRRPRARGHRGGPVGPPAGV